MVVVERHHLHVPCCCRQTSKDGSPARASRASGTGGSVPSHPVVTRSRYAAKRLVQVCQAVWVSFRPCPTWRSRCVRAWSTSTTAQHAAWSGGGTFRRVDPWAAARDVRARWETSVACQRTQRTAV